MLKTMPASEAKNKFGLLMDTVQRETVAISKKGRTSAAMMPVHEYEKYQLLKLEKLKHHITQGVEQADRGEITRIHSRDKLHSLLNTIKQENRNKNAQEVKLALTDLAIKDLASIEDYTRTNWGEKQADVYIDLLEQAISNILNNPEIGSERPGIAENCRYLPEQSHLIFYRLDKDEIVILAIPHSRMDIERYLEREE